MVSEALRSALDSVDEIRAQVVSQVIGALKKMPADLSGDDSGLRSVWEEVCVQVQGEQSCDWEVYETTIYDLAAGFVHSLSPQEIFALWLETDEGAEWSCDNDIEGLEKPEVYAIDSDVAELISSAVLSEATDYESRSIYRYIWGEDDEEEEEEEEEEEGPAPGDDAIGEAGSAASSGTKVDFELLSNGVALVGYHLERRPLTFEMIVGVLIAKIDLEPSHYRYLRSWYNGARDLLEDSGLSVDGMDDAVKVAVAYDRLVAGTK